jgi:hypothetical protein
MKKVAITVLISAFLVGIFSYGTEAQRRRRGRRHRPAQTPHSAAIAPALGELHWGMTNREVYEHFAKQIREKYRPRLAKATDAISEDRLRHERDQELGRVRRSYVRFRGQTTGWDVSFLRDEFTHGNNESMLVYRDGNSQNFYFFINDRLWKWYKAFDTSVFAGQTFEQFTGALEGRFGNSVQRQGRMTDRGQEKRWLEWQDRSTRLRAIDENRFYGFYCLVFEDKDTLQNLDNLRRNRQDRGVASNSFVDAVTSDDSEASTANQDVVDRITGRIRRRTNAPENGTKMGAAGRTSTAMEGRASASDDEDPLADLDF